MSNTLVNVAIDEKSILDDIDSCNIKIQEGSYCLTVDLQLKSNRFWKLCDPTIKWGELRIKVIIGSTIYQFLIEERDTESSRTGLGFSVWGRSKQALLSAPFSKTITDVDQTIGDVGTPHPWQTENTDAASIISYVVSNYCPDPPSVMWNTLNFLVYKESFSTNNQSPIDIISSMAAVIGANIVANIDGSLSINAFSIDTDVAVESYNDFDEIVQLDESIDVPSGYNVITVHGYDGATAVSSGSGNNSSMSTERQDTGDIYKGRVHVVRLYWVHSGGLTPKTYFHEGTSSPKFKGLESITENVRLVFGHGNTSKPNSEGSTEVTGNEDIPLATKSVTYFTSYTDYNVSAGECGDYEIMFYFADNSATTFYSFTVIEPSSDPDPDDPSSDPAFDPWGICDSMKAEKISPSTVVPGSEVRIRLYGIRWPHAAKWTSGAMDKTCDNMIQIDNEEITFQDGEANTAYPIDTRGFGGPKVKFNSVKMLPSSVKFANGSTKLIKSSFKGDAEFYSVPAKVTYSTMFNEYKFMVPHSWQSTSISAWFIFTSCETLRLNITVDLSGIETGGTRDVTINLKDHTTDVALDDVTVMIDGVWRGNTDVEGTLSIPQLAVGDHTIKMTKTGYIDSDLDDLSNDTFTVTMTG